MLLRTALRNLLNSRQSRQRRIIISAARQMRVVTIPVNQDNYMYLLITDVHSPHAPAAIVDPVDVDKIFAAVKKGHLTLEAALVTHHHSDHASGTSELKGTKSIHPKHVGALQIYGGDGKRIVDIDVVLRDDEQIQLGNLGIRALRTPCHTNTHVFYYVVDEAMNRHAVFTGDTLFIGGCGRFLEGTAEQMHHALNARLGGLPDDTLVYCGHEYTIQNLRFGATVEPNNEAIRDKLRWAEAERAAGRPTVPSTIGEEKRHNVFMRVASPDVQRACRTPGDPIATMAKLRKQKNYFR